MVAGGTPQPGHRTPPRFGPPSRCSAGRSAPASRAEAGEERGFDRCLPAAAATAVPGSPCLAAGCVGAGRARSGSPPASLRSRVSRRLRERLSPENVAAAFGKPRGTEGRVVPGTGGGLVDEVWLRVTKLLLWDALSRAKCVEMLGWEVLVEKDWRSLTSRVSWQVSATFQ